MSVEISDRIKLRPSIAVVTHDEITEFFLSNIRKTITLKLNPIVSELLFELNGELTLQQWFSSKNFDKENQTDLLNLFDFLNQTNILLRIDEPYPDSYQIYPRVFTLLEDYFSSQSEVNNAFKRLQNAVVMIVGLGSVGTWVAQSLFMSGVRNFIFVDSDQVDVSNLHRQFGFNESEIGLQKTEAFARHLKEIDSALNVRIINDLLDESFFERHELPSLNLIVNCADHPTVDETSRIIGEFSMKRSTPHIIGGGYNLHQSLIGQVVIPGRSACVECFRMNLDDLNEIDTSNITKLKKTDRKIGSFPPLSALSSSITANEAFKVLTGLDNVVMENHRTEFMLRELNFANVTMHRRTDCKWCGHEGKYYQL